MAIHFSEDFNRSDSTTVGNSWTESLAGSGVRNAGIESQQLRISGDFNGEAVVAHDQVATSAFRASVKFTPTAYTAAGSETYFTIFSNGTRRAGYGLRIRLASGDDTIEIIDGTSTSPTVKASGTFAFTTGGSVSYRIDLECDANNWMSVYIWATGGSKPGSPTLSFNNSGSAYSPIAVSGNVALGLTSNVGTTEYVEYDDVLIEDLVAGGGSHRRSLMGVGK